jgi:hypothetical protein
MPQAFAAHRVQQVREMRAAGASLEDICNSLGFSRPVLARLIREHEIPRPTSQAATHAKRDHRAWLRRN